MGVGSQHHTLADLPTGKRFGTHHTADRVGPRASLNRFERSHIHQDDKLLMPKLNMATNPTVLSDLKSSSQTIKVTKIEAHADPTAQRHPVGQGSYKTRRILNLLWVLLDYMTFFWEKAVFQIPVMRYKSNPTVTTKLHTGTPTEYLRHCCQTYRTGRFQIPYS